MVYYICGLDVHVDWFTIDVAWMYMYTMVYYRCGLDVHVDWFTIDVAWMYM